MARIKIKDLPKDMKISRQDLQSIRGGNMLTPWSSGMVSAFPDVCFTPGMDGITPVPYPNMADETDGTDKGVKSVKVS